MFRYVTQLMLSLERQRFKSTINHIVDTCPLTKFEGGLKLLHEADDDDAVIWLELTATTALAK